MSITRDHGNVVFECDSCGETQPTEENDFDLAWKEAIGEEWSVRKVEGEWIHRCAECSQ